MTVPAEPVESEREVLAALIGSMDAALAALGNVRARLVAAHRHYAAVRPSATPPAPAAAPPDMTAAAPHVDPPAVIDRDRLPEVGDPRQM
jgi:hypothetical protein